MCKFAITQDPWSLNHVKPSYLIGKQYYALCELAVNKIGRTLCCINEHVKLADDSTFEKLTNEQYTLLSTLAIKQDGTVLAHVVRDKIEKTSYRALCKQSVIQDPFSLSSVPEDIKIQEPELCLDAVKREIRVIKEVPFSLRTLPNYKASYHNACKDTLIKDPSALSFIPEDIQIQEPELCLNIVKKDLRLIKDIHHEVIK